MLGHAFNSRLGSDYNVTFSAEPALAAGILRDAHDFVDRVETYLRERDIL
jgi:uncharacterized protein (UPF0332 family)